MRYVRAAGTGEIPEGGKKKVGIENRTLLLTNVGGRYYAIDNRCPHMGGSLFDGKLEGERITCPRHHSTFDVRTGKALANASIAFLHFKVANAVSYPVQVKGDDILVGIE